MDHLKYIIVAIFFMFLLVLLEVIRELHTFKITRYRIKTDKFANEETDLKILFFSDLHNWEYGKNNRTLIQAAKSESPDLILIGGDVLVAKSNASYDTAIQLVTALAQLYPVYYALGNHEQRLKNMPREYDVSYVEYKNRLQQAGVIFLENESDLISVGGEELILSGLELPLDTYRRFRKSALSAENITELFLKDDKNNLCSGADRQKYHILLAHNPAYMDAYLKWGADLILSGHLHGGLVRLPFLGGIVTPQGFLFPKYSGEMTKKGKQTVIVSRGLGTHTLNIRFLNTPELISVRIGSVK